MHRAADDTVTCGWLGVQSAQRCPESVCEVMPRATQTAKQHLLLSCAFSTHCTVPSTPRSPLAAQRELNRSPLSVHHSTYQHEYSAPSVTSQ
ncbi:hypothetical protein BaRGS_00007433 [Batillaria attramentaria]|uniref:Uncharacterized protein n=1 Tax=Batillaria attramentaria TaxID=370345 RepID=A0ABD0LPA1_9CAEN